jgi:hypothetical protein
MCFCRLIHLIFRLIADMDARKTRQNTAIKSQFIAVFFQRKTMRTCCLLTVNLPKINHLLTIIKLRWRLLLCRKIILLTGLLGLPDCAMADGAIEWC